MTDEIFEETYSPKSKQDTEAHYQKWASTYEASVAEQGYATPGRVAQALWSKRPEAQTPILDYGCGTGLSGLALSAVGFEVIDGMDPTPNMLEEARAKEVYRALTGFNITDANPIKQGSYTTISAIGVIGAGAAPPETLDLLMHALPKDGLLAFSYNDHTLADHSYTMRLNDWLDMGAARLLFKEYGPHLPGMNMKSDVYVIEKT